MKKDISWANKFRNPCVPLSWETNDAYLHSKGTGETPGTHLTVHPRIPWEQWAIEPSLNPSFLLSRKIICYNLGSAVINKAEYSLYNHHMKIVEPSQAQNGKERKEGTEEGRSRGGEEEKWEIWLLIPGLLCQGLGVSFKGVWTLPCSPVWRPSGLHCSSALEAPTHFQIQVCNRTGEINRSPSSFKH